MSIHPSLIFVGVGTAGMAAAAAGMPDLTDIGLVATGVWWLNNKFNGIQRQFDHLPCANCPMTHCPTKKEKEQI